MNVPNVLKISDVMCQKVLAFHPDTKLAEAINLLCRHKVGGAPVVSADNHLVGIITEFTLMDVLFDPQLNSADVARYMSTEVHTLTEQDSLTRAVHMFALYGVRQLPVVRDGKLVGLVTRRDLLNMSAQLEAPLATPLEEFFPDGLPSSDSTQGKSDFVELVDLA